MTETAPEAPEPVAKEPEPVFIYRYLDTTAHFFRDLGRIFQPGELVESPVAIHHGLMHRVDDKGQDHPECLHCDWPQGEPAPINATTFEVQKPEVSNA